MKPQIFALITAIAWGVGGYFEKKGLHQGHLSPQMGITIRTFIALIILGFASFPQWKNILKTDTKALLYIAIGGGIIAGAIGMLCFYKAIKGAPLGKVMPIAFTSPLFGVIMGILYGSETITLKTLIGALLSVAGIVILTV